MPAPTRFDARQSPETSPLSVRPKDAAKMLGMSERHLWTLTKQGKVPSIKHGRLTLYSTKALSAWIDSLANGGAA